jgi:hypothetical protein
MLSSCGFRLPGGESITKLDPSMRSVPELPHELLARRSVTFGEDCSVIASRWLALGFLETSH